MKVCCRCKVEKSLTDFAKSSCKKDGRTHACKQCVETGRKERLAADPERAQRIREADAKRKRENSEKIQERIRMRKQSDAEYAMRLEQYRKTWLTKNAEKELQRGRDYRQSVSEHTDKREIYNTYMREWREKNKDRINTANRSRRASDMEYAERVRLADRQRYKKDPDSHRDVRLKSTYGITLTDYLAMYDNQKGKCAICDVHCPDHGKNGLMVDHCHKGGHVRKLLCTHCNTGIGQFRDNAQFLDKAIEYLKESE